MRLLDRSPDALDRFRLLPGSLQDRRDLAGVGALLSRVGDDVLLVVLDDCADPATTTRLRAHLAAGRRAVVAASPEATLRLGRELGFDLIDPDARVSAAPRRSDPLVFDPHLTADGRGPLDGMRLEADDLYPLREGAGEPSVVVDGRPVAVSLAVGPGRLVLIASTHAVADRWIAASDNAVVLQWALTGRVERRAAELVRGHHPPGPTDHAAVEVVDNAGDDALVGLLPAPGTPIGSVEFVRAAGRAGRLLAEPVHDALIDLVDQGAPSGALLIRGLPVGDVPATPPSPVTPTGKDHVSELVLLSIARRLGQPVGYEPEHGGDIVQNLLPTEGDVTRQTSTSSAVELEFHTETAFHPHKPRYLLLLCLRGDPDARTMLCSISQIVEHLPLGVRQVLREARFRTGVDESFTGERSDRLGHAVAVLGGSADSPTLTFDADLMVGTDAEAAAALEALREVIRREHIGVALEAGDLLVVDNTVSVHGRSPFAARFDGTDRWLQRTFVVNDLAPSATERRGRVVTTRFS